MKFADLRSLVSGFKTGYALTSRLLSNDEYMAEALKTYPVLSDEERLSMAQQYASAYRTHGPIGANIATWRPQARCVTGVVKALVRGEPAWRPPTPRAIALVQQTLGVGVVSIDYN
jgi:hypothetical protein